VNTLLRYGPDGFKFAPFCLILAAAFFLLLINFVFAGSAHALDKASFSWLANPPEDNVIGYRLYYGKESRFNLDRTLKPNFSYDYYIDFTDSRRCVDDGTGTNCQDLTASDFRCLNLYGDQPLCTVYKLQGLLFFTMTAYNAQAESDFTPELSVHFGVTRPVIPAINLLLLDRKK
jgi:hypothetical protein